MQYDYTQNDANTVKSGKLDLGPLRKYDQSGAMLEYHLEEIQLHYTVNNSTEINTVVFQNGVATMSINGKTYPVRTSSDATYTPGTVQHSGDKYAWEFGNALTDLSQLYVNKVWRDTDTTNRPDIVLALYRTTNPDEIGSTSIDKWVSERIWTTVENDYYWTCNFGFQSLYDAHGHPYYYYVVERFSQSTYPYDISYYHGDVAPNVNGVNTEQVFAPDPTANLTYAMAGTTVENSDVIINTIQDTITFAGTKIWKNIPAGYSVSNLPDVDITLEKFLLDEKGAPIESTKSVVGTVTLEAPALRYFFQNPTERYDKYGNPYHFQLIETINPAYKNELGFVADDDFDLHYIYSWESDIDSTVLTNAYVGGEGRSFSVNKVFDWTALINKVTHVPGQVEHPTVVFTLKQFYVDQDPATSTPAYTSKIVINGQKIQLDADKTTQAYENNTFTHTANDFAGLNDPTLYPYYAPDGRPYRYVITEMMADSEDEIITEDEIVTGGYTVLVDGTPVAPNTTTGEVNIYDSKLDTNYSHETTSVAANVRNEYVPDAKPASLEATKTWVDFDNKFNTRPSLNELKDTGFYTFWRYDPDSGESVNLNEVEGAALAWVEKNDNEWTCTLTIDALHLPVYTTTGKLYQYFVTEQMPEPYSNVYKQAHSESDPLHYDNTLHNVDLYVKKTWTASEKTTLHSAALTGEQLKIYLQYMGFENVNLDNLKLTFELGHTVNGVDAAFPANWPSDKKTITLSASELLKGAKVAFSDLPVYYYKDGKAVAYEYTLKETTLTLNGTVLNTEALEISKIKGNPTSAEGGKITFPFTNDLTALKLRLVKYWDSAVNGQNIQFTVKAYYGDNGATVLSLPFTLTQEKGNLWSESIHLPKSDKDGNALKYMVAESVVNGFVTTYKIVDGTLIPTSDTSIDGIESSGDYGFVNERRIEVVTEKIWEREEHYGYITRPDSVTVTLQRTTNGASWEQVGNEVTIIPDADGHWTYKWPNLPACVSRKDSDKPGTNMAKYTYRVVETVITDANNSFTSYKPAYFTEDSSKNLDGNKTLTIKNRLQTYIINLMKNWIDEGNENFRPDVNVVLQYKPAGASTWTTIQENGTDKVYTLTKENGWKIEEIKVPYLDAEGNVLQYRVQELDHTPDDNTTLIPGYEAVKAYDDLLTPPGAGYATLTLENKITPITIKAKKAWDGVEPSVTVPSSMPASVTMELWRKAEDESSWTKVTTATASKDNGWAVTFSNLPAYNADKTMFIYKVVESKVNGFTVEYTTDAGNTYHAWDNGTPTYNSKDYLPGGQPAPTTTATNTFYPLNIKVTKNWYNEDGGTVSGIQTRPSDLAVKLQYKVGNGNWADVVYASGSAPVWEKGTGDTINFWYKTWYDLPRYDANGKEITYQIVETEPVGYKKWKSEGCEVKGSSTYDSGANHVNASLHNMPKAFYLTVQKNWEKDTNWIEDSRPNAIYVIVSNPVDVLTYVFHKVSGIPENQIIGSGTILDTSRLQSTLAKRFRISPKNVHAHVYGEHGDSQFVPWSLAHIANNHIDAYKDHSPDKDRIKWDKNYAEVEEFVKKSGAQIIENKGATFYAVAMSVVHICKCIYSDAGTALSVSTMMHGEYGVDDVCLSTLVLVDRSGVRGKILNTMTDEEIGKLQASAEKLKGVIAQVQF